MSLQEAAPHPKSAQLEGGRLSNDELRRRALVTLSQRLEAFTVESSFLAQRACDVLDADSCHSVECSALAAFTGHLQLASRSLGRAIEVHGRNTTDAEDAPAVEDDWPVLEARKLQLRLDEEAEDRQAP